jgi:hypothetical protein
MESKKIIETEWTKKHELTKEQLNKLILNKLARAEQYHRVVKKREVVLDSR